MFNSDYNNYDNYYTNQYYNEYNDYDGIFIDEDDDIDKIIKHGKDAVIPNVPYSIDKAYLPTENSGISLDIHYLPDPIFIDTKREKNIKWPLSPPNFQSTNKYPISTNKYPISMRAPSNVPIAAASIINPHISSKNTFSSNNMHYAGYVTSNRENNANIFYATGWDERPEEFNGLNIPTNNIRQQGNNIQWLGSDSKLLENHKSNYTNDPYEPYMTNGTDSYFILKILLFILLIILICILCIVICKKKYIKNNPNYRYL
jgi:hypothetical protein